MKIMCRHVSNRAYRSYAPVYYTESVKDGHSGVQSSVALMYKSLIFLGPGLQLSSNLHLSAGLHSHVGVHLPAGVNLPAGFHLPVGLYLPAGLHLPAGVHLPEGLHLPAGVNLPAGVHLPLFTCLRVKSSKALKRIIET